MLRSVYLFIGSWLLLYTLRALSVDIRSLRSKEPFIKILLRKVQEVEMKEWAYRFGCWLTFVANLALLWFIYMSLVRS